MRVEAPEPLAARAGSARPAAESYSRITNYSADAGAGSHIITNISENSGWRAALLGTVAAGALWLGSARYARADCAADGTTLNCTGTIAGNVAPGVVDGGILVDGDNYDTLNVYELDADITPDEGVDGINFHRTAGDITIYSDTRPYTIFVYGADADGIDAYTTGAITIDHTGDITSEDGRGISASSTGGAVSIALDGDIDAAAEGIFASGVGGVTVTTTIDNTVTGGSYGISALNFGGGAVEIEANGHVEATTADGIGVYAYNEAAGTDLSITTESVMAGDLGILARNYGTGDTTITANGAVMGGSYGMYVEHFGTGGVLEIYANGDVSGTGNDGIFARSYGVDAFGNSLSITTEGLVTGGNHGIRAFNYGDGVLEIVANGDVGDPASFQAWPVSMRGTAGTTTGPGRISSSPRTQMSPASSALSLSTMATACWPSLRAAMCRPAPQASMQWRTAQTQTISASTSIRRSARERFPAVTTASWPSTMATARLGLSPTALSRAPTISASMRGITASMATA